MIKSKIAVLLVLIFFLGGMVSADFYVVEGGERKKIAPAEEAQKNAAQQSSVTSSGDSSLDPSNFVSVYGDSLKGALDMAGFGLTGLPSPDDPEDAATKSYVDETLSDVYVSASNTSSGSSPATLSTVLSKSNVADQVIRFSEGVMLGSSDTSAVGNSIALGNGAEAQADNSVAVGENSVADQQDTMTLGSNQTPLDLSVSGDTVLHGDLRVEGQIKGINVSDNSTESSSQSTSEDENSPVYWSQTIDIEENKTKVDISHLNLNNAEYQVAITSVGSITNTGVFNKTREELTVRSEGPTKVDLVLTQR